MYHEPHLSQQGDQNNYWTDIPEGGDMLPGTLPSMPVQQLDDLFPTGHHAVQQDEYGTGIDPHSTGLAMPGDDPEQMPKIRAEQQPGTAAENGAAPADGEDATPGNHGRTAAGTSTDAENCGR
ncbi:hypothetical protein [uncultured Gemmiger sp.]|uniref:hypothetical protein n=1 Tax=uncultured Gemmiger sp. TaxID=1623490 RepID=UPI0025EC0C95|nr:hypothetical protein [uncultured Gemmiger sp.]